MKKLSVFEDLLDLDSEKVLKPLKERKLGFNRKPKGKILLLSGPTASGKTQISLILAELLNAEVISSDSIQIYRNMDIGSSKVSLKDRLRVPHHLIDVRHVQEPFNVVDFFYEARQLCDAILRRGKVPIIVGGSGFYYNVFIHGPPEGPPPVLELRKSLERRVEEIGIESLFLELKKIDPTYASTITCRDRNKIIRAFEIIILTGKKVSSYKASNYFKHSDYDIRAWFLNLPKVDLYQRIEERCYSMLENSFIDEVKELKKQGIETNPSASKSIGYKQCLNFLNTEKTQIDYQNFLRDFISSSKKYAKRQYTWFKNSPYFRWFNMENMCNEVVAELIAKDYLLS